MLRKCLLFTPIYEAIIRLGVCIVTNFCEVKSLIFSLSPQTFAKCIESADGLVHFLSVGNLVIGLIFLPWRAHRRIHKILPVLWAISRGKLYTDIIAHQRNHGQSWQLKPSPCRTDGMYRSPDPFEHLHGGPRMDTTVCHSLVGPGWLLVTPFSFLLIRNWRKLDMAMATLVKYWFAPCSGETVDIFYLSCSASRIVSS